MHEVNLRYRTNTRSNVTIADMTTLKISNLQRVLRSLLLVPAATLCACDPSPADSGRTDSAPASPSPTQRGNNTATAVPQTRSAPELPAAFWQTTLTDSQARPVTLAAFRGRPLVLNFWARWCPPCLAEIPDFIDAGAAFRPQGVELIGIAVENEITPIADFVEQHGIDYPVLIGELQGLPLMEALGNGQGALPFTVVIDKRGNIVARKVGRMSKSEMNAAFTAALGQ